VETGVIAKSGAWFEYEKQKIAQGREAAKSYLQENPKVFAEVEKKVKEAFANGKAVMEMKEAEDEEAEE